MYSEFSPISIAKTVKKCVEMKSAIDAAESRVIFSFGNSKTGALVPSVSLIPVHDCGECSKQCAGGCYDVRHDITRPNVAKGRAINSAIWRNNPDRYFSEISANLYGLRFFRFHVGGEIVNADYFRGIIRVALENQHCKILVFTKNYAVVNSWIQANGELPKNLQVVFSAWPNRAMQNPYNLPTSYPVFDTGKYATIYAEYNKTVPTGAKPCGGDCSACALNRCGCFDLKRGESVYFIAH